MQLDDLFKPLEQYTKEELEQKLFDIRHRRQSSGASKKTKEKKQARKDTTKKVSATEKLLENLSPEELELLLKELQK